MATPSGKSQCVVASSARWSCVGVRLPKLPSPPPSGTVVSDGRQLSEPRSPGTGEWDEVGGKKSTGPRGRCLHHLPTLSSRCNRCGPVSGSPATAARGMSESRCNRCGPVHGCPATDASEVSSHGKPRGPVSGSPATAACELAESGGPELNRPGR